MKGARTWLAFLAVALLATGGISLVGQSAGQAAQPQSAKPGINDTWKSSNIDPLVAMLESESREIYHEREKLAALVGLRTGMSVADVGAGSGFMVELFARAVGPEGRAYAVDINAKLLDRIAQHAQKQGLKNLKTILATDDSAELPANSVDVVFICDTYHHFEYPQKTMASIRRALRRGGELVIVEFKMEGATGERMRNHVRAGQEVFTKEIQAAGFEWVRTHDVPWLTENYILRFRKVGE